MNEYNYIISRIPKKSPSPSYHMEVHDGGPVTTLRTWDFLLCMYKIKSLNLLQRSLLYSKILYFTIIIFIKPHDHVSSMNAFRKHIFIYPTYLSNYIHFIFLVTKYMYMHALLRVCVYLTLYRENNESCMFL